MPNKAELTLSIGLPSIKHSETVSRSMRPDIEKIPKHHATVEVKAEGSSLLLRICAKDVTALRSSMNSVLRTVSAVIDVLEQLEQFQSEGSRRSTALNH